MKFGLLEWTLLAAVLLTFVIIANFTRRYVTGVSSFLAAGRCGGRYLLSTAEGMALLGAVAIVSNLQVKYYTGFASEWFSNLNAPISMILTLSAWIVYRYRKTRAMTLAQLFEMRYSRNFRVFAGIISFTAGLLGFGIIPAIAANFFVGYCGFPEYWGPIPMVWLVAFILLTITVYVTLAGGQVALIISDFIQGMFANIVLLSITVVLLIKFNLSDVFDSLLTAPPGKSMVNPFDLEANQGYTVWFFLMISFMGVYGRMCQGEQIHVCSATDAHEAKMAGIVGSFRFWAWWSSLTLIPICTYAYMHDPAFAEQAAAVNETLSQVAQAENRSQLMVPVAMTYFIPRVLVALFGAVVFAAFITTNDTQVLIWSSIFVQDVLLPLRKKPLSARAHVIALRLAVIGLAVFAFFWSCIFRQTQHMQLLLMTIGAIFAAGAGSVLIGALYWKKATTAGAWAAMAVGSFFPIAGVICDQVWMSLYGTNFFLDFTWMTFLGVAGACLAYVVVSLLTVKEDFNIDKLLHRGKYAVESERLAADQEQESWSFKSLFGYSSDSSFGDKIIYVLYMIKILPVFAIVLTVTIYALIYGLSDAAWAKWHYYMLWFSIIMGFGLAVWIAIGGCMDLRKLFVALRARQNDEMDDGRVMNNNV